MSAINMVLKNKVKKETQLEVYEIMAIPTVFYNSGFLGSYKKA